MKLRHVCGLAVLLTLTISALRADEWTRFRGADGTGTSTAKNLPLTWSDKENIVWRAKMPGPGSSSPIIAGDKIILTSYSGYGIAGGKASMDELMFHVVCVDRKSGNVVWDKKVKPNLPETQYKGFVTQHGYASSTPATDGKHIYVFFGKTGVFCFDLDGNQIWKQGVGTTLNSWGTATSPILYKDRVIVNASIESGALVALDKLNGKELWRAPSISSSWSTPVVVQAPGGEDELVVSGSGKVQGLSLASGKPVWWTSSFKGYVCPAVVAHMDVVYALQTPAGGGGTSVAVRLGGKGDVTGSHTLWQKKFGSKVPSLVYHDGHVYFCNENGVAYCLKADSGAEVYKKALSPKSGTVYASPLLADGKIYYVSQSNGTYVVAASPEFKQLAHNTFADDRSRTNASPIVDDGCVLLRTDMYLYCIGKKG